MDDNSFYGAPAGWYPDPLGLPQLRWWDSTAWTHQTAEARAPMVMQETTYAWPEDELERDQEQDQDLLTRRERRERERHDINGNLPPTAMTLLQLEPPSVGDVQSGVPDPSTQHSTTNDFRPATTGASAFDDVTHAEPVAPRKQQAEPNYGEYVEPAASQSAPAFDWSTLTATQPPLQPTAQPQAQPWEQNEAFQAFLRAQTAPHRKSTQNFAVWMIALIPLLQLVLSLLILTAFGTAEASAVLVAIWLAPYPIIIGLAALDRLSLKRAGHQTTAHWLWAILTAPVYLVVRAIAAIRESGGGFGPVLVWFALGLLQIGAIVAVPGLLIGTLPSVFANQAEQSIVSDAAVIGTQIEVTCPALPPVLVGQTFECSGVRKGGDALDITVSLQRVNGWIDWRVDDWGIFTIG